MKTYIVVMAGIQLIGSGVFLKEENFGCALITFALAAWGFWLIL